MNLLLSSQQLQATLYAIKERKVIVIKYSIKYNRNKFHRLSLLKANN